MAMFPVGETMDPRMMTDQNRAEARRLRDVRPEFLSALPVQEDGSVDAEISVRLANPNPDRGVRWHVTLEGDDRWDLEPNHRHAQASGYAVTEMTFRVRRIPGQSMLDGGCQSWCFLRSGWGLAWAFKSQNPATRSL